MFIHNHTHITEGKGWQVKCVNNSREKGGRNWKRKESDKGKGTGRDIEGTTSIPKPIWVSSHLFLSWDLYSPKKSIKQSIHD